MQQPDSADVVPFLIGSAIAIVVILIVLGLLAMCAPHDSILDPLR